MNQEACSICHETKARSRLIDGKCFNCTYLEQKEKTKRVLDAHNIRQQQVTKPNEDNDLIDLNLNHHKGHVPNNPANSSPNGFGNRHHFKNLQSRSQFYSYYKAQSPGRSKSPDRLDQCADCINCGNNFKLVRLVRGLCQSCLKDSRQEKPVDQEFRKQRIYQPPKRGPLERRLSPSAGFRPNIQPPVYNYRHPNPKLGELERERSPEARIDKKQVKMGQKSRRAASPPQLHSRKYDYSRY